MSSKEVKAKLADIREDLIKEIKNYLTAYKCKELELTNTIVYATVDDQFDHTVYKINKKGAVMDDSLQADTYDVIYKDITNEILIKILESLEKGKFLI